MTRAIVPGFGPCGIVGGVGPEGAWPWTIESGSPMALRKLHKSMKWVLLPHRGIG